SGLTKYTALFRFNLAMIAISISLDITLIGVMSLPNTLIYAQFHPLAYLLKLHIEMGMADLIAKVVKASHPMSPHLEPRTDSNDIMSDLNNNKPLSRSTGSKPLSLSYVVGRDMLSPNVAQPEQSITRPERQPFGAGSQPGSQADADSGRLTSSETLSRPHTLCRHFTEPGILVGLELTRQSRSNRQDSSSTVRDHGQEVACYV
ncbi:hypothetical protein LZ30DRAFT_611118, partial [Colletotrichum cereale]